MIALASWLLLIISSTAARESTSMFQVRRLESNIDNREEIQNHRRQQDFVITFSQDGTPIELPLMRLQLFPTTGTLSNNGEVILASAFSQYLKDELDKEWEKDASIAALTGVSAEVMGLKAITSIARQSQDGTEATILTTLTFDGLESPPSDAIITAGVAKATNNLNKFVSEYLVPSGLPEFSGIQSAAAIVASRNSAPTPAPVIDDERNGRGPNALNEQLNNTPEPSDLNVLIPASVAGLAVFMLTAFFIAQRRKLHLEDDDDDDKRYDIDIYSGSRPGKDEIEVSPNAYLGGDNGGRTAMHMNAMMDSSSEASSDIRYTRSSMSSGAGGALQFHPKGESQYVRRMLDSYDTSNAGKGDEESSAYTSEYSEGKYYS